MSLWHKVKVSGMGAIRASAVGPMSRRLDPDAEPERLNVVATKALVRRLNEWRAANGFVGKSEAARILIERALDAEARSPNPQPKDGYPD